MELSNYFSELNAINVGDKAEKKNGLTYLSWAWAWAEVKKKHPEANYTIYENANGLNYHHDGKTAWVKTGVTVNGIEHIEYLPVMNHRNQSIGVDALTSFDVNKTIQRSLTKAVARHGLGLYIYAGEDLPEDEEKPKAQAEAKKPQNTSIPQKTADVTPKAKKAEESIKTPLCDDCSAKISDYTTDAGKHYTADEMAQKIKAKFGKVLCPDCINKVKSKLEAIKEENNETV
jgi:uncharacterized protein YlaI